MTRAAEEIILRRLKTDEIIQKLRPLEMVKIEVNFDEYHCTKCEKKSFNVLYDPYRYICKNCGFSMSDDDLRNSMQEEAS